MLYPDTFMKQGARQMAEKPDRVIWTQVGGPDGVDLVLTLKFADYDPQLPRLQTLRMTQSVAGQLFVQLQSRLPVNNNPPPLAK